VIAANTKTMASLDTCAILVAESEAKTVGVATLSMEFGIEYGWSAEMGDLYVVPEMRGKGISRRLMEEAERVLRERGAAGYQVTVTPYAEEHHGLRSFYVKLGFEDEGRAILYRRINGS
jgi:GNAT superfamily N-acetyltransferase